MTAIVTGIIVGSGMHDFAAGGEPLPAETGYGVASAPPRRVELGGRTAVVLARHGEAHTLPPHAINYRANVAALQAAGCGRIVCVNTVGVIADGIAPGDLVVPEQVIDYTWGRAQTFFDGGAGGVVHLDFAMPFSAELRNGLLAAGRAAGVTCHDGGIYGATQGPRLETAAEVDRLERDGVTLVGMTGMPEFALVRELDMQVACLSLAVNPAAGRGSGNIHADIERSSLIAKTNAISLLKAFLQSDSM